MEDAKVAGVETCQSQKEFTNGEQSTSWQQNKEQTEKAFVESKYNTTICN